MKALSAIIGVGVLVISAYAFGCINTRKTAENTPAWLKECKQTKVRKR
jgi:hypothetical protein